MTDREALIELIDALRRKGTEQDGNWGWASFQDRLKALQEKLEQRPGEAAP